MGPTNSDIFQGDGQALHACPSGCRGRGGQGGCPFIILLVPQLSLLLPLPLLPIFLPVMRHGILFRAEGHQHLTQSSPGSYVESVCAQAVKDVVSYNYQRVGKWGSKDCTCHLQFNRHIHV